MAQPMLPDGQEPSKQRYFISAIIAAIVVVVLYTAQQVVSSIADSVRGKLVNEIATLVTAQQLERSFERIDSLEKGR